MLSLEDIASIKLSVEICDKLELKREILCADGSDYVKNRNGFHRSITRRNTWNAVIERKTAVILQDLRLTGQRKEKVMSVVLSVGLRMLTWAEYHEGTLGFSREYSIKFLNSSFFTAKGIIDNKRAAEELMKDRSLSIKQKYKLACLYCFSEHIPILYKQLTTTEIEQFYHDRYPCKIKQPNFVKIWSYYLKGEIDMLKGEKNLDQYRLETAIESGCKAAVEYCFEKTSLSIQTDAAINAAVETLRNRKFSNELADSIFFGDYRYKDSETLWVPSDYYVDILCFLFSRMREDQKIRVLKKDIEGVNNQTDFRNPLRSRVLEYFLDSPYQCYFMKTAELMWEFLPEKSYAYLLLLICDKIGPKKVTIKYGEEKSFDYRNLLRVFWSKSPENYKRYVFRDKEITYTSGLKRTVNEGKDLLARLLTLKHFTYEDRDNIRVILDSATDEEKENIIYSEKVENACFKLMKEQIWKLLDEFVSNIFHSKEQAIKFKKEFSFMENSKRNCIALMINSQWNAAESFVRWSALPEEEVIRLKKEMISSRDGRRACIELFSYEAGEIANKFCEWCFSSDEEIKAFKKELVFCEDGMRMCSHLVVEDKLKLVNKFINWGLLSEEEIRTLKENVAYTTVRSVCEKLISNCSTDKIYIDELRRVSFLEAIRFNGGKWEQIEMFVTWCFSSEEDINDFKRKLLTMGGKVGCHMGFLIDMHLALIAVGKWEDAEIFFAWLGLSFEEIRNLKKKTLLCASGMKVINISLHNLNRCRYSDYATDEWEKIELYLRWCLVDKNAVLEFRDRFDEVHGFKSYEEDEKEISKEERCVLNKLNLLIEDLLNDLSQNQESKKETEVLIEFYEKENALYCRT